MKHLIKIESVDHGVLGVKHAGLDQQYCEAGELVILKWQPDAGWGLQEAHYTDKDGNVTAIEYGNFVMPDKDIIIGGTFKRFSAEDWADNPYPRPNAPRYLKFTANVDGSSVGFCCWSEDYEPVDMGKNMQYSIDGGLTWEDYRIGVGEENIVPISLRDGESVMFRGVNDNLAYYLEDEQDYIYTKCFIGGSVTASGDVTSLLNGIGGNVALTDNCFSSMFYGCTGLTQAPTLPATTLVSNCYSSMFYGCTGLTQAPTLPATTMADRCYDSMFYGCTGLTQAPTLPATTLASSCYNSMFYGCTGLTQAPTLPATTLVSNCYSSMFYGCTGLTQAPTLPATTMADSCYSSMFSGCTGITSHDVATLNNSTNTFNNNSSCASLTIHADTPPTIANSTITGLKADCIIYVPAASVDAYKAAQYWSARAAYIQAIP